ncbi:MAG: acyl transferase, partial [Bacteroidota bacterium]|nr:acyl transferase [Bacteroidota bacterium]
MLDFQSKIFNISNNRQFNKLALQIFHYQATENPTYKEYLQYLGTDINKISDISKIPFLPIEFFKNHKIISGNKDYTKIFYSSGTTSSMRSKHYINDLQIYETSFTKTFEHFYGNIDKYCILALLPNYLENESSSLIYMTDYLIKKSGNKNSGFYLNNTDELIEKLIFLNK